MSLIEKGKIVDTGFFGTFAKLNTDLVYCPGPKSILKLVENEENVSDLPTSLLEAKLT